MQHFSASILIGVFVVSVALGCNGEAQDEEIDTAVDAVVDVVEETPDDQGDAATTCNLPETPCMAPDASCHETTCTGAVSPECVAGFVVDDTGAPLYCQGGVACAGTRCYPGHSDETGFFAIPIPSGDINVVSLYFAGNEVLSPFCRYEGLCDGGNRFCEPFVLRSSPTSGTAVPYDSPDPPTLTEDIRIEASDTGALILPAGAEVKMGIGIFDSGEDEWMALVRYPIDEDVPCFVDPENLPLALYVVWPHDTLVTQADTFTDPVLTNAALDLPNETGLAEGTVVDIYVVGGVHGDYADLDEGEWGPVTTATVTSDGRIQTHPADGIGYLTWFGVYAEEP